MKIFCLSMDVLYLNTYKDDNSFCWAEHEDVRVLIKLKNNSDILNVP